MQELKVDLVEYGWEDFFANAKKSSNNKEFHHGRVVSVHKSRYEVITEEGIFSCEIIGNLQFQKDPLGLPAVGDWVLLDQYRDTRIITEVLKRKSLIKRQKKHDSFPKLIAANIDKAIIVQAAKDDFNIKRLERILVHVYEAGIEPLVVINKIDLIDITDLETLKENLLGLNKSIKILFTSFVTGEGIHELEDQCAPRETVMFIGSSGVGKSSIINYMLGYDLQETQSIIETTGKGKHTTTARRLIKLDSGILVIDTPGTREFGMNEEDDFAIKQSFDMIDYISLDCRFSNCGHTNEPSCAVQDALENGILDMGVYKRYITLSLENEKTAKQMRQGEKKSSQKKIQPLRSVRAGKTRAQKKMNR